MKTVARLTWECVSCLRVATLDAEIPSPLLIQGLAVVHVDLTPLDLKCHHCGAVRVG